MFAISRYLPVLVLASVFTIAGVPSVAMARGGHGGHGHGHHGHGHHHAHRNHAHHHRNAHHHHHKAQHHHAARHNHHSHHHVTHHHHHNGHVARHGGLARNYAWNHYNNWNGSRTWNGYTYWNNPGYSYYSNNPGTTNYSTGPYYWWRNYSYLPYNYSSNNETVVVQSNQDQSSVTPPAKTAPATGAKGKATKDPTKQVHQPRTNNHSAAGKKLNAQQ